MSDVLKRLQQANPNLKIMSVTDEAFKRYGGVLTAYAPGEMIARTKPLLPTIESVAYEPSVEALEAPCEFNRAISREVYGGMRVQVGWCYGQNTQMNAVEYHKGTEINVCLTDVVLLVGHLQDVVMGETISYDSNLVEAFFAPAGSVVELSPWNLHFAPIHVEKGHQFATLVYLPKGTNEPLTYTFAKVGESRLLFAVNKWLIGHPDAQGLAKAGAYMGITGPNIIVNPA